jgi:hypothetical protein
MQTYGYSQPTHLNPWPRNQIMPLGAAYEGASVTIGLQTRVFTRTETRESRTITINMRVQRNTCLCSVGRSRYLTNPRARERSCLIFYQRRYKFKDSMFLILGAWGRDCDVDERMPGGDHERRLCNSADRIRWNGNTGTSIPSTLLQRK